MLELLKLQTRETARNFTEMNILVDAFEEAFFQTFFYWTSKN